MRAGLQSSSPESVFVAQTPPRPTVRTWRDMSEAAADGAQTKKNAWVNPRLSGDMRTDRRAASVATPSHPAKVSASRASS